MSKDTPWGDEKPTLDEYVEHYKDTMTKDEILHRVNDEMELDLDPGLTKGDLLAAVYELEVVDGEQVFDLALSGEDAPEEDPAPEEMAEVGLLSEPESSSYAPEVPAKEEIVGLGYSPSAAAMIVRKFEELRKAFIDGRLVPKNVELVIKPGLRLTSKQPREYWCIGKPFSPGKPQEFPLEDLSKMQLLEIETKRGKTMIVEDVEIEIEVEIDSDE